MFSSLKERIGKQLLNELPFVVYSKPDNNDVIGIFQGTDTVHGTSDFSATGFVFAPFDDQKDIVLIPIDEKFVAKDFGHTLPPATTDVDIDSGQRDYHIGLVEKGIAEIKKRSFKKVVLSRRLRVKLNEAPIELFQKLLATYTSAFCYLWHHPKVGTWLGATPEILLRTENKQFTTMSLAGTQAYQEGRNAQWGHKELTEQAIVTNYIKSVLNGKVADLQTSEIETLRAGNLLHLRTRITGRMVAGLKEVIQQIHPTPAVCGMPMTPAKDFILKNENYDREFYTGFLGELNFKKELHRTSDRRNQENQAYRSVKTYSELFVNLRCMQLDRNEAFIYVGGGVTIESDSEKEWQETVFKSATMLEVLQ